MIEEFERLYLSNDIPEVSCIYFLLNGDELNYVGNTVNLKKRLIGHKKQKIRDYNEWFDSILYLKVEDDKYRKELERKYILDFEPKWNYQTESFSKPVPNPWRPDPTRFDTYTQR